MLFLKIIILCIWCNRICWHALMFKKHIIFQILYIIVVPLCPASLKRFVFYKVPPSDKHSLLWLASWPSALWLTEHVPFHNRELQLSVSFTISSSPKGEQSRVTDTAMMLVCICSTQATVKTTSDRLYTPLWCDPVSLTPTHTHRHTQRVTGKTLIADSEVPDCHSKVRIDPFFFLEIAFCTASLVLS